MDLDLIKLLEESGFTGKEARVYLALLELGQGNVTEIAKISDLNLCAFGGIDQAGICE